MRDDTKVIQGDTDDFVIKVNDGEIPVCTGEFYRMRRIEAFVKEYEDSEDTIKLYGITSDGKTYVSEKDDFAKTDEEFDDWAKRSGCDADHIKFMNHEELIKECQNIKNFEGRVSY